MIFTLQMYSRLSSLPCTDSIQQVEEYQSEVANDN